MIEPKLDELNDAQRAVALHTDGPAMMAAVAGSGKTRAVIEHTINQLNLGGDPERFLLTTFSKSGAEEMNDRLRARGAKIRQAKGDGGVRVGTLHSVSLEIVRDGSPWVKYEVDGSDKMRWVLKEILGWRGMKWEGVDITKVEGFIAGRKNELVPVDKATHPDRRYVTAYRRYEDERELAGLLTFDDMTPCAVRYLLNDPDARLRWQGRFDVVVVDEFQDTNTAQMVLVKLLAEKAKTYLVVGDDDQCIYQWRGSKPEFMTRFECDFPRRLGEVKTYRAEANYRSRPGILEIANKVIVHNDPDRVVKSNIAQRETNGKSVSFEMCADMDAEAETVAEYIKALKEDGFEWGSHAVLYRCNAQSRSFEESFIKLKIPHIVIGGLSFYKRKEIVDILAYLKLAINPNDNIAFRRAVNKPFRYIGKQTLEKITSITSRGRSELETVREFAGHLELQRRQVASLERFVEIVDDVRERLYPTPYDVEPQELSMVLSHIVQASGYEQWIVSDEGTDTAENSRVSNLRELVRTANRFGTAEEMLAYIAEVEKAIKARDDKEVKAVRLMTIHKSKGLEFPVVYLVGAAQGILPHARAQNVQHERNLMYVAVTRAKERLIVTCPGAAWVGSRLVALEPSQFVAEAGLLSEDRMAAGQVM